MNLLSDLDGWNWLATAATLIVCVFVLSYALWAKKNDETIDLGGPLGVCFFLAILCVIGAFASYSRFGDVPRKTAEGSARIVHIAQGRTFHEYICADSCRSSGGYTLQLDSTATRAIERYPAATRFRFTYPDKPKGGALTGVSLVVENIEEAESGTTIYEQDLRNHPLRIAVYLADLALLIFTIYFSIRLTSKPKRSGSDSEDDTSVSDRSVEDAASLHLE